MLKYERYLNVYSDVVTFLTSTNTEDSQKEMTVMSLKDRKLRDYVFAYGNILTIDMGHQRC